MGPSFKGRTKLNHLSENRGPPLSRQGPGYAHNPCCRFSYSATTSEATAEWVGGWADGLLTVGISTEKLDRIVEAFRRGGGKGKPIHLKVDLSWATTEE